MSRKQLHTNRKFNKKQKGLDTRTLGKQKRKEALVANDQRIATSAIVSAKLSSRDIAKRDYSTFKEKLKEVKCTLKSNNLKVKSNVEMDELLFDFSVETSSGNKVFIDLAEKGRMSSAKKMLCNLNNYDYQNIPFDLLKDGAEIKLNEVLCAIV